MKEKRENRSGETAFPGFPGGGPAELTCIRCPMGCRLLCEEREGALLVRGNSCLLGEEYARTEVTAPVRTVTSTVLAADGVRPVVAVKTVPAVPKQKIPEVMRAIRTLRAQAPAKAGDVLLENVAGTGAAVVLTADLPRRESGKPEWREAAAGLTPAR